MFIDNKLNFHEHVSIFTMKVNRVLAVMYNSFEYMDNTTFVNLYNKSLIHPILEYGNAIWVPHYILDQRSVERMQRRATKLIHGLQDMTYSDCLTTLNLPSLQYR